VRPREAAKMSNLFNLFWIFLILISLQPVLQRQLLAQARKRALSQIAHEVRLQEDIIDCH
jgi:hypothetical protein